MRSAMEVKKPVWMGSGPARAGRLGRRGGSAGGSEGRIGDGQEGDSERRTKAVGQPLWRRSKDQGEERREIGVEKRREDIEFSKWFVSMAP